MLSPRACQQQVPQIRASAYRENSDTSLLGMLGKSSLTTLSESSISFERPLPHRTNLTPEQRRQELVQILDMALLLTESCDFDDE